MDSTKLILMEPVLPPTPLERLNTIGGNSEEGKEQIARDFESLLLNRLLDEMKSTIGEWGFEKDGPCQQIHGIFWLYLAQELANNGGFGLWKDIYKFMTNSNSTVVGAESLDKSV